MTTSLEEDQHMRDRLRVLHIISSMDPAFGGPTEGLRQIINASRDQVSSTVACLDGPGDAVEPLCAEICRLGRGLGRYRFNPQAPGLIARLAVRHDVGVVHGFWQYHTLSAHKAMAGRMPYVVFPHGHLDPRYELTAPTKHLKKRIHWRLCEYRLCRDAAAVCFTTERERDLARIAFTPYCVRELVTGFGVSPPPPYNDSMKEAFLRLVPQLGSRPYLLFLSRLHPMKGCDLLIDAFADACADSQMQLVMAGPDSDGIGGKLRARAQARGVGHKVHWPGLLRGPAKWGAMYGADAFCLFSLHESFGLAPVEAMACATPILVSDQINMAAAAISDGAGLSATLSPASLSSMLRRWCATERVSRAIYAQSALTSYRNRFDVSVAAARLTDALTRFAHLHVRRRNS